MNGSPTRSRRVTQLTELLATVSPEPRIGAPPGELRLPEHLAYAGPPRITVTSYDPAGITTKVVAERGEVPADPEPGRVLWIAVEGLSDLDLFRQLQRDHGIHPLAMEDVLSCRARPKLEVHHQVVQFVAVDPMAAAVNGTGDGERVSLFLGEGFVISVESSPGETFEPVRRRLALEGSRLRRGGPDTLLQALIDTLVDRFFPVLDTFSTTIEELDESLDDDGDVARVSKELHELRVGLQKLRRHAWPLREAVNALARGEIPHVGEGLRSYFGDVSDHLAQIIDQVETSRELASSIRDLHFSALNHRMNEVMRRLTVISTIFLPLTFIAGVYGMNYKWIPELELPYGYFICLGCMAAVGIGTWLLFRLKKWA